MNRTITKLVGANISKVHVPLSPTSAEKLEGFSRDLMLSTAEGFADIAVELLDWAINEASHGRKIVSTDITLRGPVRACPIEVLAVISAISIVGRDSSV